jgi:hypothetical protein
MAKMRKHPVEVRERAVRLVLEHRDEYETKGAAIASIAQRFGCAAGHFSMPERSYTLTVARRCSSKASRCARVLPPSSTTSHAWGIRRPSICPSPVLPPASKIPG